MAPLVAITRAVTPAIVRCEVTYAARVPIDVERARAQHDCYEDVLRELGCAVERLPADQDMADAVFVEDIAVVLGSLAVLTRPGAASRRVEIPHVEQALARYRPVSRIEPPGTMDGGDVLVVGSRVFAGLSGRTNLAGIEQLRTLARPLGYAVEAVTVRDCLHLKSAVTRMSGSCLLVDPVRAPLDALAEFDLIEADPEEANSANVLCVGEAIVCSAACPRTSQRLRAKGWRIRTVDVSELAKAEGALTCCSLIFEAAVSTPAEGVARA